MNTAPGPCSRCGELVEKKQGFTYKAGKQIMVLHRGCTRKRTIGKLRVDLVQLEFKKAEFSKGSVQCHLCLRRLDWYIATVDHVVPVSRGGLHEPSNFKMACRKCNRKKGSKTE